MKIAIVSHQPTVGGLTRFMLALVHHLALSDASLELTLFAHPLIAASDGVAKLTERASNIEVVVVSDRAIAGPPKGSTKTQPGTSQIERGRLWRGTRWLARRSDWSYRLAAETSTAVRSLRHTSGKPWYLFAFPKHVLDALNTYDLVYFSMPFFMEPASISVPVVATVHDFNHMHFPQNFTKDMIAAMRRQSEYWFSHFDMVVNSTPFMERETWSLYRTSVNRTSVIYLPPYSFDSIDKDLARRTVDKLRLPQEYILYPAQSGRHKNIITFLRAMERLKGSGRFIPFVITGVGIDSLGQPGLFIPPTSPLSEPHRFLLSSSLSRGIDYCFPGYVSDHEIDCITRCARLTVSTSLYEAGCGPALDGWQLEVPVAMSNIPPYLEQMRFLKTDAWLFDPNDPDDVAARVDQALSDHERSAAMVRQSREAIGRYSWWDAATLYRNALEKAVRMHRSFL